MSKLNSEQKQAVNHNKGLLLVVAGAGTGKTTVITERIAKLIKDGRTKPEEILAVTFTDKAANEMEERVDRALPLGYSELWIMTFHGFCQRVLEEYGMHIGLPGDFKLVDQTKTWMLVRENLESFNLDYYRPLGNPTKFIHALLNHFSRCKDEGIYPDDYLKYADSLKKSLLDEKNRITEIANAYHVYQKLLLDNSLLDFGDLINYCIKLFEKRPKILEYYKNKFKYILIDEFQDTNYVQYNLIKLLNKNNLLVVADDDQCLPGDTLIDTPEGKRKISLLKKNNEVLTAVGRGHIGVSKINKVFKNKKSSRLLTIKTRAGTKIVLTDNHKVFCYTARTAKQGFHYVYLMHRQDIGWRIGVTDDLIQRLKLERSADRILAIRAFDSDTQARYHETLWSLKYGMPSVCFQSAGRNIIMSPDLLKKLYQKIDVEQNVRRLAKDLNIDLDKPHFCLDAVSRGDKVRIKINIQMCYRNYRSKDHVRRRKELVLNPKLVHRLILETSDVQTLKILEQSRFLLRPAKKGKKLIIDKPDIRELGMIARRIHRLVGGFVENKFGVASIKHQIGEGIRTRTAIVMPAKNLVLGNFIPVRKGREIVYDQVVDIKEEKKNSIVYDLEINKTHNFIANDVVVHNSIYAWRGAAFNNVLQFRKDFPQAQQITLKTNYRSQQNILDLSYKLIQNNNPDRLEYIDKINKKLISNRRGKAEIKHLHFNSLEQEAAGIVNKIKKLYQDSWNDFVILVRANNSAIPFARELERQNIPHQFLASRGLYTKEIILNIISFFKLLDNYHESLALNRFLSMPIFTSYDLAKFNYIAKRKAISLYEAIGRIPIIEKYTELAKTKKPSELLVLFVDETKLIKHLEPEDIRLLNLFLDKIKEFEAEAIDPSLKNFMQLLGLELESGEQGKLKFDIEQGPDMVRIMTAHSAKGLEFKYVFIVSLVDLRFPTIRRAEPIEMPEELIKEIKPQGDYHLQEERRLFYVAMTRAKDGLFFTSAADYGGQRNKKVSRFLQELNIKVTSNQQPVTSKIKNKKSLVASYQLPAPNSFSFSQLSTFKFCPYEYYLRYILKVPMPGSAALSYGITIHNTLQKFLKNRPTDLFGNTNDLSLKNLSEIYKASWVDDWFESRQQKERYYKQGLKSLKLFYNNFKKENPEILKLEQGFNLDINNYTIRGRIDRIDQGEIIDYKTGNPKIRLDKDDKLQLLIYQIAAQEILGIIPEKLTYYYLNNGSEISFLGNNNDIIKAKEEILEIIKEIHTGKFPCKCGKCTSKL